MNLYTHPTLTSYSAEVKRTTPESTAISNISNMSIATPRAEILEGLIHSSKKVEGSPRIAIATAANYMEMASYLRSSNADYLSKLLQPC